MSTDMLPPMIFKRKGEIVNPLATFPINSHFIIGIYQGKLSEYDILIKYRQLNNGIWSRIRTPKHIHWAVDILIKMHSDLTTTKDFMDFLLDIWEKSSPIKNNDDRHKILDINYLLDVNKVEIEKYERLSEQGEYSIKFLVLLAKLLMIQEKTNLETAFVFKNLLNALKKGDDIFSVVSKATYNGR